jgi:eukaryotic-like serine/threonine-protein kinase
MTMKPGAKLGPYEIVALLGAGGMGQVYRAIDPRIGREVAIKVLPSGFAGDSDRLGRFEQEARAAGMLNHPGILSVHDVGHENGVHFLVSELLEGETLREKLGSPLPQRKVIDYALQVAKGLTAAHDKGIIHRDLKPENLFVTNDGRVKILDFGLAKLSQTEAGTAELSKLDTGAPLSAAGMILGTVGYMSPEQVRGKPSDARSDIFAFGVILYEMISGKRAFHGETTADTMSAILGKEPPEISDANLNSSPAIARIVEHCMEKNPSQRFQSMHDVAFYLETLSGVSTTGITAPVVAPARSSVKALLPWTVAALMAIVAAGTWFSATRKEIPQSENTVMRFIVQLETSQRSIFDAYGSVAISPDGRSIVFTGVEDQQIRLYIRNVDTFESRPIAGTEGGRSPFFSPDGKWLGFLTAHHLKKVQLSGDDPVALCPVSNPRGGSWSDDGTILFSPFYYAGLSKISSEGGTPQPVTQVDKSKGERNHRWPFLLPGGKVALFTIGMGGRWSDAYIGAVRLDTGERKVVLRGGFGARYLPTGHMIFGRGDALYVIGFDPEKLQTIGDPVQLVAGVGDSTAGTLEYAFSQNGTLLTLPIGLTFDEGGALIQLNRKGEKIPFAHPSLESVIVKNPKISPDGSRVAGDQKFEVWIYDLERGTSTRLTSGSRTAWPRWTPDGKRVTYNSERLGFWNPFWRAADGSDQEQPVFTNESILNPTDWSSDGKKLLLYRDSPQTGSDVVVFDTTDKQLKELVATPATEWSGIFSPDAKWIAYRSDESGRFEIYVRSFQGPEGRWQVSTDGGTAPMWKQQNELIYMQGEKVMRVPIQTEPSFSAGTPELLFEGHYVEMDVTSDHQRFIATVPKEKAKQDYRNVVINWFEEVRKRAPSTRKP